MYISELRYAVAAVSDCGSSRPSNEDAFGYSVEHGVYVVYAGLAGFEGGFEHLLSGVEQLADAGAVLGGDLTHIFAGLGQRAFAAEHFDAHRLQVFGRSGGLDAVERGRFEMR